MKDNTMPARGRLRGGRALDAPAAGADRPRRPHRSPDADAATAR
ncbi:MULTISPECIES: hypothetical protein [unclassified Halorubrum]|nr:MULTISPECIES: hypothetical protein [unclassified Halorubrum]